MALLTSVASGWTGRLGPFTLKVDGIPLSLVGLTVEITLHKWNDSEFVASGTVYPDPDQITNKGQVYYDPSEEDFIWTEGVVARQNYEIRWKVTDGSNKVVYFPNGPADLIAVYQA